MSMSDTGSADNAARWDSAGDPVEYAIVFQRGDEIVQEGHRWFVIRGGDWIEVVPRTAGSEATEERWPEAAITEPGELTKRIAPLRGAEEG